ncbi:hypothetical protein ACIBG7_37480 [Nonomuraea sp. NPDC050328]|uniref:hypothetical protein n=1 Tax=Nonomuraea sp. NPDC050328 TaxID=3364361 RepID=UPI0037B552B0
MRVLVAATGVAALLVALPAGLLAVPVWPAGAVLVGLCAAVLPGSAAPGVTVAAGAVAWTLGGGGLGSALTVGTLLYLHHTSAALAALTPVSSALSTSLVRGWAARTALVLAASALLSVVIGTVPPLLRDLPAAALLTLGAAAAVALVALVRRLLRTDPPPAP